MSQINGRIHIYGNNIDTDRIIPGKYTKTLDLTHLAAHVLEDLDPEFHKNVKSGDILVAGWNFGCGSSREQAPLALQAAGITAVVAASFARIFYRNAINIGLPVVEIGQHDLKSGTTVTINLQAGTVIDQSTKKLYTAAKTPSVMIDILQSGGLVNYLKNKGGYAI